MWLALSACERATGACDGESGRPEAPAHLLASQAARVRGRELFGQHCALCHGARADGQGVRRAGLSSQPPSFRDPGFSARHSPQQLYCVIRNGKRGTSMPAWPTLSERQTWDLVAFVLRASEPGR